ncbi:hypothetical protein NDU88_003884 [Pleurodeles waltl]|uniref:Uncharacterized protein n=1 Tax=Pleurodeles waltl TaxID=8319 RepID=A0AAV7KZB7_PLEWA|nr:hypothetical protein NDU88_003884 [Pleurodeles waltl]
MPASPLGQPRDPTAPRSSRCSMMQLLRSPPRQQRVYYGQRHPAKASWTPRAVRSPGSDRQPLALRPQAQRRPRWRLSMPPGRGGREGHRECKGRKSRAPIQPLRAPSPRREPPRIIHLLPALTSRRERHCLGVRQPPERARSFPRLTARPGIFSRAGSSGASTTSSRPPLQPTRRRGPQEPALQSSTTCIARQG